MLQFSIFLFLASTIGLALLSMEKKKKTRDTPLYLLQRKGPFLPAAKVATYTPLLKMSIRVIGESKYAVMTNVTVPAVN